MSIGSVLARLLRPHASPRTTGVGGWTLLAAELVELAHRAVGL